MDFGVRRVAELVRLHCPGRLRQQLVGARDCAAHALLARRQDQFGPEIGQHLPPLDRYRFRHGQDQAVAACSGDEGEPDSGVARGGFDQRRARLDLAFAFQRQDHVDADSVLDAGNRVEELELQRKVGGDALLGADARDADQRRVADCLGDAVVDPAAQRAVEYQGLLLGHGASLYARLMSQKEDSFLPTARVLRLAAIPSCRCAKKEKYC